ncbi:unnamed protein product [Eruca vesicaria subsp. sativa]|uniref:Peptidase A1 domain-containing protein n=1 Tax=Eruca vesicaria subsp. sativa TaxID=29727 RepID=A0ABC8KZT4_ERUVS|nr:unnamed protein product [Eruca vesicaria subsp. sativa]
MMLKLQIGTPPVEIEAFIDTGSEITWTNCLPCSNCLKPSRTAVFDPSKSSTYKEKISDGKSCTYDMVYLDKSYTKGTFATETVRIQSTSGKHYVMPGTTFGCSHNSSVDFKTVPSGVVGLN